MKAKILIAEDDANIRLGLVATLESEGYAVTAASDGAQALRLFPQEKFDLVVLDIMMPKASGYDVCRDLRARGARVPVLFLTAKGEEIDKVVGLKLGADDYVTKPFSPRELVLRIKKLLARVKADDDPVTSLRLGELELDASRHQVSVAGVPVELTATEFKLLEILARRRGRVQTRDRLLQDVWGYDNPIDSRTVDTHMRRLREKIGAAAEYLETIRGVGYRFKAEVNARQVDCMPTAPHHVK